MFPTINLILVLLVIVYAIIRIERLVEKWLDHAARVPEALKSRESMPADMMMIAQQESEPWAQQQAVKTLEELYSSLGSWDNVREVTNQGL